MKAGGLRLETPTGEIKIPTEATDDPAEIGNVDAVLVGVKAWQVGDAAIAMRPLVGPDTVVIPLQNGVEAATELASVLGSSTLGGMCGTLSFIAGPGHIRSVGGQNFIKFGELDNKPSERVERLRQCFARAKHCGMGVWGGLSHTFRPALFGARGGFRRTSGEVSLPPNFVTPAPLGTQPASAL